MKKTGKTKKHVVRDLRNHPRFDGIVVFENQLLTVFWHVTVKFRACASPFGWDAGAANSRGRATPHGTNWVVPPAERRQYTRSCGGKVIRLRQERWVCSQPRGTPVY